jgi:hypothetical protein
VVNREVGRTIKTEPKAIEEVSVVEGFSLFDYPILMNG